MDFCWIIWLLTQDHIISHIAWGQKGPLETVQKYQSVACYTERKARQGKEISQQTTNTVIKEETLKRS